MSVPNRNVRHRANPRFGLRTQLTLLFLVIGLLPLIVATAITSIQSARVLRDSVVAEEQSLLTNVAVTMGNFLETTTNDLLWLSETVTLNSLVGSIAKRSSLNLQADRTAVEQDFMTFLQRRQIGGTPVYKQIRILSNTGVEFVRVDTLPTGVEVADGFTLNSRANRDYFLAARDLPVGAIYTSAVELSEEFGEIQQPYNPVISYATPIYYDVTFIGVLVVDVQLMGMLNAADIVSNNSETTLYLIDQDGFFLRHPDETKRYGRNLNPDITLVSDQPDLAQGVVIGASGVADIRNGIAIYHSVVIPGMNGANWTLIAVEPIRDVLAVVVQQLVIVLGVVLIVSAIVALIAFFFANSISTPIRKLTQQAVEIASGNFNQQISIARTDEIGGLAQAFNSMTQQLRDLIGTLEERVQLRTVELEEARKQAESASEAKSVFLSNMSHELRTPLNVVIGYTSSMLDMPAMYGGQQLPSVFRDDIRLIQHNGRHLLSLINDVLDLSKIEAGRLELSCETTNLAEIFTGVVATSVGLIGQKPIQITPDFPSNLPTVWADPLRVRQILLNLMSNAIKFTDTGSVTLWARQQGERVVIAVKDTGIGIPEDALETLFDRFQQVQKKSKIQGTGLGLDISQHLAQMHGSEINVESKVGQGSVFMFSLPLNSAVTIESATRPMPSRSVQNTALTVPSTKSSTKISTTERMIPVQLMQTNTAALQTILLVEDDSDTRSMLHRTLDTAGYVVIDVATGEKAIEFATNLLPDLVILDIQLPDINGWQIIERLRGYPETEATPIIAISAHYEPERIAGKPHLNFLGKPIEPELLLQQVQTFIQQAESSTNEVLIN